MTLQHFNQAPFEFFLQHKNILLNHLHRVPALLSHIPADSKAFVQEQRRVYCFLPKVCSVFFPPLTTSHDFVFANAQPSATCISPRRSRVREHAGGTHYGEFLQP